MLNLLSLNRRRRAVSFSAALTFLIGLMVPAAVIAHFVVFPMMAEEADGTTAEDVTLSQVNGLADVISGSAIDITVQNSGEAQIAITATKIRCANGTEFPGSSWRTPWYPEDGSVETGKKKTFTFVFDHHPVAYGASMLELVITFNVDDGSGENFSKTIIVANCFTF